MTREQKRLVNQRYAERLKVRGLTRITVLLPPSLVAEVRSLVASRMKQQG